MASPDTVREFALALPGAEEAPSYGTPGFRVRGGRLFARMLEDRDSVVVKIDFADRAALAASDPDTFFWTPHYEKYPMLVVRLSRVGSEELRELLVEAWRLSAPKRLVAAYDAADAER